MTLFAELAPNLDTVEMTRAELESMPFFVTDPEVGSLRRALSRPGDCCMRFEGVTNDGAHRWTFLRVRCTDG